MKTKVITGLKKEVLVIEAKSKDIAWGFMFNKYGVKELLNWELLGKPDEIKEEDAMELVEQSIHSGLFAHYVKGIPVNTYCYKTALDSFHSALESEIYWNVNPIDIKGQTFSNEHENKWQQAQEKTFDKKRTLIFVKN